MFFFCVFFVGFPGLSWVFVGLDGVFMGFRRVFGHFCFFSWAYYVVFVCFGYFKAFSCVFVCFSCVFRGVSSIYINIFFVVLDGFSLSWWFLY